MTEPTDLHSLLGDRYKDVIERAADALAKSVSTDHGDGGTWAIDAAATLAAVLPDIIRRAKEEAWDEALQAHAGWMQDQRYYVEDEVLNPYRAAVTRCATCDCLKPCDRMLDPEET